VKRALLWLLPARRVRVPRTHEGIRLRISVPEGPLIDADSDQLYYLAKFGGCDDGGWTDLLRFGEPAIRLEIKALRLPGGDWPTPSSH